MKLLLLFSRVTSNRRGIALVSVLWLLALVLVVVLSFSLSARLHREVSVASSRLESSDRFARLGLDLWLAQLQQDTFRADRGVIMTEIMSHFPPPAKQSIRVNELVLKGHCGSDFHRIELFNISDQSRLELRGWTVVQNDRELHRFQAADRIVPHGFFVVPVQGRLTNQEPVVVKSADGDIVDQFTFEDGPTPSNASWQVLPDGWNGRKPAQERRSSDPAWTTAPCTMGESNGSGIWLRVGNQVHEGVRITQYNSDGIAIGGFNFATDASGPITPEGDFLRVPGDTAVVVVSNQSLNGLKLPAIGDSTAPSVLFRNAGKDFPRLTPDGMYIGVTQPLYPLPEGSSGPNNLWTNFLPNPDSTPLAKVASFKKHAGRDWLVRFRTDTDPIHPSSRALVKGDSELTRPLEAGDPGTFRLGEYATSGGINKPFTLTDTSYIDLPEQGRLWVSEVASLQRRKINHLVISRFAMVNEVHFEIFNPTDETRVLESYRTPKHDSPEYPSVSLEPGEYWLVCKDASLSIEGETFSCDDTLPPGTGNLRGAWIRTRNGPRDRFGTDKVEKEFREGEGVVATRRKNFRRRVRADTIPLDTDDNRSDFESFKQIPELGTPGTGFAIAPRLQFIELVVVGKPLIRRTDQNEYIEIFHSGNDRAHDGSVDVLDLAVRDSRDGSGRPSDAPSYPLGIHPQDPDPADNELKPGQVGMILRRSADTRALGIDQRVKEGAVRLLTTRGTGFLTDGLSDRIQEVITLERSGLVSRVLEDEAWNPIDVKPRISRQKRNLSGANTNRNWPPSIPGGSPGYIPFSDALGESWGWGGRWGFSRDANVGDTIFIPSLGAVRSEEDYGYFRIITMEDESGKINLLTPRNEGTPGDIVQLTIESDPSEPDSLRTLTIQQAKNVISYVHDQPDNPWLTPGEFFSPVVDGNDPIITDRVDPWNRLRRVYSSFRIGPGSDRFNINTAPYEALRSIPIKSTFQADKPPNFVTHRMALEIMKRRSGGSIPDASEGPIEISPAAYEHGSTPIDSPRQVCEMQLFLDQADRGDFECEVFSSHTKTGSDGVFRVEVEGGILSENGEPLHRSRLESVVDRRPVTHGQGPVRSVYRRFQ